MGRSIIDAPIDQVAAYIKNFEFRKYWDKNLEVSQDSCKPDPLLREQWSELQD